MPNSKSEAKENFCTNRIPLVHFLLWTVVSGAVSASQILTLYEFRSQLVSSWLHASMSVSEAASTSRGTTANAIPVGSSGSEHTTAPWTVQGCTTTDCNKHLSCRTFLEAGRRMLFYPWCPHPLALNKPWLTRRFPSVFPGCPFPTASHHLWKNVQLLPGHGMTENRAGRVTCSIPNSKAWSSQSMTSLFQLVWKIWASPLCFNIYRVKTFVLVFCGCCSQMWWSDVLNSSTRRLDSLLTFAEPREHLDGAMLGRKTF